MPKVVDHDERRLAFAEAAFRVIAKRGFSRVTMRAVADEAGFTTGALVHYFKSKDDLLIEASEHVARVLCARASTGAPLAVAASMRSGKFSTAHCPRRRRCGECGTSG